VLQVLHIEPAVNHAMLPVACGLCSCRTSLRKRIGIIPNSKSITSDRLSSTWKRSSSTLQQCNQTYNRASRKDQRSDASPSRARDVWIICCALFVVLESMLDDDETALLPTHDGLKLLQEYKEESAKQHEAGAQPPFEPWTPTACSQTSHLRVAVKSGYYAELQELKTVFGTFGSCRNSRPYLELLMYRLH